MKIEKMAARDADRWAAAEMFYGEGAGTRRKLLSAEIQDKYINTPGYFEAFERAYNRLDMNKYAKNAIKERKSIDRKKKVDRNVRGVLTGNTKSLTTSVAVVSLGWYVAKELGYDEKIKDEVKLRYNKTRWWVRRKKAEWKLKNSGIDKQGE